MVVYALLGSDYDDSPYTQSGERVAHLAVSGIRLVIDQFRADVTKTLKDGTKGKLRIDSGDPRDPRSRSSGCGGLSRAPTPPVSSRTIGKAISGALACQPTHSRLAARHPDAS
jgi:hypothetical protein